MNASWSGAVSPGGTSPTQNFSIATFTGDPRMKASSSASIDPDFGRPSWLCASTWRQRSLTRKR
jgi:hypothetical protein